jgi:hypothetical protein
MPSPDHPTMRLESFTAQSPLLLLTEFPADAQGGGAVLLRSLIPESERDKILWVSFEPPSTFNEAASENALQLKTPRKVRGLAWVLGRRSRQVREVYGELLQVAKARNVRAIWIVPHGHTVPLAALAATGREYPMHLTVHDDPPFANTLRSRRAFLSTFAVESDFKRSLIGAKSIDVICQPMADRYKRRYGVHCAIAHRAMEPSVIQPSPSYDFAQRGLIIGILGNTYNYQTLPVLAKAGMLAAKRLNTHATIRALGRSRAEILKSLERPGFKVELLGHVDEAAAVEQLKGCFLVYLNYPFSRLTRVLRQTSFPTKLSTYIMASRPILLHAPSDSSTAELATMSPFVVPWHNCDVEAGADLIYAACQDPLMSQSFHADAERVRAKYYDSGTNRQTLLTALNALPEGI